MGQVHPILGVTGPSPQTETIREGLHPVFGAISPSPQTVGEGLHPIFGDTVWGRSHRNPSQHAGGVHHAPFGKAHEWQEGTRHVDHSEQVD